MDWNQVPLPEPVRIPLLRQTWDHTAFVHWRYPAEVLRPLVPEPLEIEELDGSAWVSLVMFQCRRTRPPGLPPVLLPSDFTEINLRTYVNAPDDRSALWFFALEASNPAVVTAARVVGGMPYNPALTCLRTDSGQVDYSSRRLLGGTKVNAVIRPGRPYLDDELTALDHFLTARWGAYSLVLGRLRYTPVEHPLWHLCHADMVSLEQDLTTACGLPAPPDERLLHYAPALEATLGLHRRVGATT